MRRIAPKSPSALTRMRTAGRIVALALEAVRSHAQPGVTTAELDRIAEEAIRSRGARPAFKGYRGYPASICTSINEQVVHGIPGPRVLQEGDLLSVDCGAVWEGYTGDAAVTIEIGECSPEARRLVQATRAALAAAIAAVRAGVRVVEISRAVQQTAEAAGFSVVTTLTGHGVGRRLHEEPMVPNYVSPADLLSSPVLPSGATIAIEPMVNAGAAQVRTLEDKWTVVTLDGKPSAHFEHTVAVTEAGASILTLP
jgi:methionyl aminopeptidase